jgi:hypothetical protein
MTFIKKAVSPEIAFFFSPPDHHPKKKKQVVETTCESHEKTSMGNFKNSGESYPLENFCLPGRICQYLIAEDKKGFGRPIDNLTQP